MTEYKITKLQEIQLKNFKSFDGQHRIGPFTNFTSIIGPNGGGKSNVIDAICFVLGISVEELRINQLSDLITKFPGQQHHNQHKESKVTIIFQCEGHNKYLKLSREITRTQLDNFQVNDKSFQQNEYQDFLLSKNIIIQARTFLLLQNDTARLSIMKPDVMTQYFERISGSIQFKESYEKTKKNLDNYDRQIEQHTHIIQALKSDKRKMKQMRQNNQQSAELLKNIEELELKLQLLEFLEIDIKNKSLGDQLLELDDEDKDQKKQRQEFKQNIENLDKELTKLQKEEKELANQKKQFKEDLINKSQTLTQLNSSKQLLTAHLKTYEEALQKQQSKQVTSQPKIQKLQKEKEKIIIQKEQLQQKLNKEGNQNFNQLSQEAQNEYQKLTQQFLSENYQKQLNLNHLKDEQLTRNQEKSIVQNSIQNLEQKVQDIKKQNEEQNSALNHHQQQIQEFKQEITQKNKDIQAMQKKIDETDKRAEDLKRITQEKEINVQKLELQIQNQEENENLDNLALELKKSVKNCKGALWTSISMRRAQKKDFQRKYEVVVKQALMGVLNYIVVDNAKDATLCKDILKSRGEQRDMIILNKVPKVDENVINDQRNILNEVNKNRNEKAQLVYDLIQVQDDQNEKLMDCVRYFLQGKICVPDYQSAIALKSNPKMKSFRQIITIEENNTIDMKSGMITCYGDLSRFDHFKIGKDTNKKKDQNDKIQDSIQKILDEIEKSKNQLEELGDKQLQMDKQNIQNEIVGLEKKIAKLEEKIRENKKEIQQNDSKMKETQEQLKAEKNKEKEEKSKIEKLQKDIDKYQIDLDGLEKVVFQNFMTTYNIQSLNDLRSQDFEQVQDEFKQINDLQRKINQIDSQIDEINQTSDVSKFQQLIDKNKEQQMKNEEDLLKIQQEVKNLNQAIKDLEKDLETKDLTIQKNKKEQSKQVSQIQKMKINNVIIDRKRTMNKNEINSNLQKKKQLLEQAQIHDIQVITNTQEELMHSQFYNHMTQSLTQSDNMDQNIQNQLRDLMINYSKIQNIYNAVQQEDIDQQEMEDIINENHEKWEKELDDCNKKFEEFSSKAVQEGFLGNQEDFEKTEQTIKETQKILDEKLKEKEEETQKFEQIQLQRKELFMRLFTPVSEQIDTIYKELSENQRDKSKGSAFMYLENQEFPFLGGIIYSPTPAGKAYVVDKEGQLSGGEKTMASLAMFITINKIVQSPFLIFDEADAFLDSKNVKNYLKIIEKISKDIQCLIISHKKDIFEHSDSLVGVTFQPSKFTSISLSLDNRQKV